MQNIKTKGPAGTLIREKANLRLHESSMQQYADGIGADSLLGVAAHHEMKDALK